MSTELDGLLGFGLWPGKPAWLVGPITDELGGRRLAELPTRDAADVLDLVAWLQAVRAGLLCIPILAGAAVLDGAGVDRGWAPVLWTLTLSGVLVLPLYGVLVGVLQLRLRRSRLPEVPLGEGHPSALRTLRVAPWAAAALALLLGVVAH